MKLLPAKPDRVIVWLQNSKGMIFPWFADEAWPGCSNTPDTPIVLPQSCEHPKDGGNEITLIFPGLGKIVTNLQDNGRTGECNRCGQCCGTCEHLAIHGRGVGHKNGTTCAIYRHRLYIGLKGCVLFPCDPVEINKSMTACTFSYGVK